MTEDLKERLVRFALRTLATLERRGVTFEVEDMTVYLIAEDAVDSALMDLIRGRVRCLPPVLAEV